jgi:hypothetical protein
MAVNVVLFCFCRGEAISLHRPDNGNLGGTGKMEKRMSIDVVGMATLALAAGVLILPVRVAAGMMEAENASFLRSFLALAATVGVTALLALVFGAKALLAAPVILILSFMYILGVGFLGAIGITIMSAVGYALMEKAFAALAGAG